MLSLKRDEGYIKFNAVWKKTTAVIPHHLFELINPWREKLFAHGLIGKYPDNIGYGNTSIRNHNSQNFYITGTATGREIKLTPRHYTRVTSFNLETNSCECEGPIQASAESMTHAAFYKLDASINAVIHIHNLYMWENLFDKIPTSKIEVTFGTVEMAREIVRLYLETNLPEKKIMVMGGHKEGIISFGKTAQEAGDTLLAAYSAILGQPNKTNCTI